MNAVRRWLRDALFIVGVTIIVGLAALNVLAWRGVLVEDQPEEPSTEGVTPPTASSPTTTAAGRLLEPSRPHGVRAPGSGNRADRSSAR